MAEPAWAILVAALAVTEMSREHCPTGCLRAHRVEESLAVSLGPLIHREALHGGELYLRKDTATAFGPFRVSYGISVTSTGSVWAGVGFVQRTEWDGGRFFVEGSFMPGLYLEGNGADLGGPINARAGIEFGHVTRSGMRIGLSFDHRSHGGMFPRNPGVETVQLRISF